MTSDHPKHSIAFLNRHKENHSFAADLREVMTQLLEKLVPLKEEYKDS